MLTKLNWKKQQQHSHFETRGRTTKPQTKFEIFTGFSRNFLFHVISIFHFVFTSFFFFFFWVWITNMFLKLRIGKLCGNFKRSQFFNFNKAKKSLPFCVGIVLYWKREMENLVLPAYYLAQILIINNWFRRLLFLPKVLIMFAFDSWILIYSDCNKVRVVFFELSF